MKRAFIILSMFIAILCITVSCSDGDDDSSGTLQFVATSTSGGITILNYRILDGSNVLINQELIQTDQSSWSVEHTASSGNIISITGSPNQQGETLTIQVLYNGEVISSSSSQFNAVVNTIIP